MFIWDFNAIFVFVLFLLFGIVFAIRAFYTLKRQPESREDGYFRQCLYCSYVYMDYLKLSPCRCPRCLSYFDGGLNA
jgi:hypothetical protein